MHSQYKRRSHAPRITVGNVVVIHCDNQPRGMWKLGRVEELLTGADGEHRAAILRVAGKGKTPNAYDDLCRGCTLLRYLC